MTRLAQLLRRVPDDAGIGTVRQDVAQLRADVDGLRSDVDGIRHEVDGQKDHVTVQMAELGKDLTVKFSSALDERLIHFEEGQWEARLAFHFRELTITIRYWAKRLVILGIGALGTALWALAGPKLAALVWHWMGWQP